MKRFTFLLLFLFFFSCSLATAASAEKAVLGPARYDVKERYGKDNVYRGNFKAMEGLFAIKLRNGDRNPARVEFIDLILNGETLLREGRYDYGFIACIVRLHKENSFEILLKDAKPSGFKRPPLPARFLTMWVTPFDGRLPEGVYGVHSWEGLKEISGLLRKIKDPESAALAVSAINLRNDVAARAQAMQRLSDRKDKNAGPFITSVFSSLQVDSEIRAEAALGLGFLGDPASIPALINGMLDPEEKTRLGSTRALSFYPEEETREPLSKTLEQLDAMRRNAVMRSIAGAGWKPIGTMMKLAESGDPYVSSMAIAMLGTSREPRATALLIKLFRQPGRRDVKAVISALGKTGDRGALELLAATAKDPGKRAGNEAELGEALADSGDRQYREIIAEMMNETNSPVVRSRLQAAYRRLSGKE